MHDQTRTDIDGQGNPEPRVASDALFPIPATLSLDEIMLRVRKEVRRRRDEATQSVVDVDGTVKQVSGFPRWQPSSAGLEMKQVYALSELLQFSDVDFVDTAYRVLLRRAADADGRDSRLAALRSGSSTKVDILGSIRFSPEGMRHSVHVDGLLLPYKLNKWSRIRFVGPMVSMCVAIARLPRLSTRLQIMETAAARETQRVGEFVNRTQLAIEGRLATIDERLDTLASKSDVEALSAELINITTRLQEINPLKGQHDKLEHAVDSLKGELEHAISTGSAIDHEVLTELADNRRGLNDLQRRLMAFLDGSARDVTASAHDVFAPSSEVSSVLNAQYVSFEDAFRGSRDDIKQRASHYLKALDASDIKKESDLVLDLGCGRGEWLEVLAEHGYRGRGIDLNSVMLEDAIAHGLDVHEADALSYLCGLSDNSVAAITSMHLVEHLPHETLIRLLDEALRVLRPNGLLILETPNPENLAVGACWFYMDPTHRNPIPPALLQWLVQARGFSQSEIQRLSENRSVADIAYLDDDLPGAKQVNQLIDMVRVAPDYAVVAIKPGEFSTTTAL